MSEIYRETVDPAAENNPHAFAIAMVGHAGRVLEVGCSVGHVTEHLVAAGNEVVGVELDPVAATESERFTARTHVRDLDVDPLSAIESGPFDAIVLGDVLEHFRDPAAVLADLTSLLAHDGRLVISIPHVGFIDIRLMLMEGRWEYQPVGLLDRTHLRWFTRESLRELLRDAGFTAVRVERVRLGIGDSGLPIEPHLHGTDVIRFLQADPEWQTFQFVVEAHRADPSIPDALDAPPVPWPDLDAERAAERAETDALRDEVHALREQVDALSAEVEAWKNSKLARLASPARAVWARLRR